MRDFNVLIWAGFWMLWMGFWLLWQWVAGSRPHLPRTLIARRRGGLWHDPHTWRGPWYWPLTVRIPDENSRVRLSKRSGVVVVERPAVAHDVDMTGYRGGLVMNSSMRVHGVMTVQRFPPWQQKLRPINTLRIEDQISVPKNQGEPDG